MADANLGIKITAKDDGSVAIEKVAKSLKSVSVSAKQMQADMHTMGTRVSQIGSQIASAFGALGLTAGLAGFTQLMRASIEEAKQYERATLKLDSVLRSTGGAAGLTSIEMKKFADEMERATGVENDQIINAQAILATFTRIGRETFPQATQAALDMSAVMGQPLEKSIVQIGKAMQDPISGATALRRVGVALTDQQKEQIKTAMELGDLHKAQGIILRELAVEFGGAAAAMQGPLSRAISGVTLSWKNLKEEIGNSEMFKEGANYLSESIEKITASLKKLDEARKAAAPGVLAHQIADTKGRYEYELMRAGQYPAGSSERQFHTGKAELYRTDWEKKYGDYVALVDAGMQGPPSAIPRGGAAGGGGPVTAASKKAGWFDNVVPWNLLEGYGTHKAAGMQWADTLKGGKTSPDAVSMYWDEEAAEATRRDVIAWWDEMAAVNDPEALQGRASPDAVAMYWDEQAAEETRRDLIAFWDEMASISEPEGLEGGASPMAVAMYWDSEAAKAAEVEAEAWSKTMAGYFMQSADALTSSLGQSSQLMLTLYEKSAGHGKKYWEWYKGLAEAEIVASSASAIVKSWQAYANVPYVGWALAGAQSAIIIAAAATQLAALNTAEPKQFALGGIVNRPTYGMLGEAGPEAVLPLNRMKDLGGSTGAQNITINTRVNLGGIHGGVDPTVLATVRRELAGVTVGAVQAALANDQVVRRQIRTVARGG